MTEITLTRFGGWMIVEGDWRVTWKTRLPDGSDGPLIVSLGIASTDEPDDRWESLWAEMVAECGPPPPAPPKAGGELTRLAASAVEPHPQANAMRLRLRTVMQGLCDCPRGPGGDEGWFNALRMVPFRLLRDKSDWAGFLLCLVGACRSARMNPKTVEGILMPLVELAAGK